MRVRRISEELQKDEPLMGTLRRIGVLPDKVVGITATEAGVLVGLRRRDRRARPRGRRRTSSSPAPDCEWAGMASLRGQHGP